MNLKKNMVKKIKIKLIVWTLMFGFLSVQQSIATTKKLQKIDLYVVNKQVKFATPLQESKLKQPAYFVKYSIINHTQLARFENFLKSVPAELKKQKRREIIDVYVMAELFFEDNTSVSFGIDTHKKLSFNGHSTDLLGTVFIDKLLKPYISPTFGWYKTEVESPKNVRSDELNFRKAFDGFEVSFSQKLPDLDAIEQSNYFTQDEFDQIFTPDNGDRWVGINVHNQKIVSVQFPSNLKNISDGGMSPGLLKKYKEFIMRKVKVGQIKNRYQLKTDIVYRVL